MKRVFKVFPIIFVCLALTACGKDYNKNDWSSIIASISWSMKLEDVIAREGEPDEKDESSVGTIVQYKGYLDGNRGTYIYRFGDDGTLDFLKFKFESSDSAEKYIESFIDKYGKSDGENEWYGNVQGEKAVFAYIEGTMVEVDKVK